MKRMILVPLDCLLDTRAGALATLSRSYLDAILQGGSPYFGRVIDDFEWLGQGVTEKFKARYEARDVEVLKASFKTQLVPYLTQLIASIMMAAHEHPQWNDVGVEVNYWPYKLTRAQIELFKEAMTFAIGGGGDEVDPILDPNIEMVSIPPEELSLDRLARDWQTVYMYDFIGWTNTHAKDFEKDESAMKAVNVEVFVPVLFRELPNKADLRRPDGSHINPAHEAKRHFSLWLNLNYLNPQMFSIPDPDQLKTA